MQLVSNLSLYVDCRLYNFTLKVVPFLSYSMENGNMFVQQNYHNGDYIVSLNGIPVER